MEDSRVLAAIIAAIVSLITVYWIKPLIDKNFHLFQLKENYKHDQAKKIKETIGKYKSQLINSGELLNNRLKNYAKTHEQNWININGDYSNPHHYIDTTVHRFLSFFAYIKLIQENLEYLDTTFSESNDLEMIRYFRIFIDIMTDVDLFEGVTYDANYQTDHFFRNPFSQYVRSMIDENKVLNFDQFKKDRDTKHVEIIPIYRFFDGISPEDGRLRIERIKSFHIILIAFLNSFGYDFQSTPYTKIDYLKEQLGELKFKKGLIEIVNRYKLKTTKSNAETLITKYT